MATPGSTNPQPPKHRVVPSIDELTEDDCFDLLRHSEVGRLAVQLPEGGVDIFPTNFVIDERSVLLRTDRGTKLDSLQTEHMVAFEADHFDYFERSAWSVVVKGRAARIDDHNELFRLLNVDIDTWHPERKPFFVRITPSIITGRRFEIHRRIEP